MQKTYCTSCGSKIEYSLQKPKFCSNCGELLESLNHNNAASPRRVSKNAPTTESFGDETNYSHVPDIGKLEYDVEYSSDASLKKITFEDLKNNAAPRRK
tara:strand:+ start:2680 stop:2976 length:297 start_codon:yes stop_codon:yes gene_type:complete